MHHLVLICGHCSLVNTERVFIEEFVLSYHCSLLRGYSISAIERHMAFWCGAKGPGTGVPEGVTSDFTN